MIDPFDPRRALEADGLLRVFNELGVLAAADVHVARRLGAIVGEADEQVALAAALAVRGPRLGHTFVDLATIRDTATVDDDEPADLSALPWPEPEAWTERVAASALVAAGEDGAPADRPLRLVGSALYLDRYWREERRVADDLRALAAAPPEGVRLDVLADGLTRLFAGGDERQLLAAASAVLSRLAVVGGGPGTGKTTVARIVALLAEQAQASGAPAPLVALAAPTGKAAARLEEAVHGEARSLEVADGVRTQLLGLGASTLHRLLGRRPGSNSRFRHGRDNRLPHDVVIVDETSMVSLSLMASLVAAVRPDARLVLVGDPGQLASIEAGAVLGDVVGPTVDGLRIGSEARARLEQAAGVEVRATDPPPGAAIADGIVVLERVHRYGSAIAGAADAIRRGDADAAVDALRAGSGTIAWIEADAADPLGRDSAARAAGGEGDAAGTAPAGDPGGPATAARADDPLAPVRAAAVAAGRAVASAAHADDATAALAALGAFRLLCAHRRGAHGAATWLRRVEGWLADAVDGFGADGEWYVGRPLLVTRNDYGLRLYNGDTGVVIASGAAAFERGGEVVEIRPSRLGAVETVYAMTVHKSQGSQFDTAAVLLPPPGSRILTRELLYTAVTRARERLILVGTEEMVRAAVERPVARASGLRARLWGSM